MTKGGSTSFSRLPERYQKQALEQGVKPDTPLAKLQAAGIAQKQARPSKHGNVRTTDEAGRVFDSKKEERDFRKLVAAYGIKNVIRQVSIPLDDRPPISRLRPDFLIIHERLEGGLFVCELLDSKGHATAEWLRKAKRLKEIHGIEVKTI